MTTSELSSDTAIGEPAPPRHRSKLVPGEPALWLLLIADLFQFTVFFVLFSYRRGRDTAVFEASARDLHVGLGLVNTIVLIIGSVLVAVALHRWRDEAASRAVSRLLWWAGISGVVFILIKVSEYLVAVHDGHTIGANAFYMFYFCLTGFHLVHVIAGSVGLFCAARAVRNSSVRPSVARRGGVYSVGLFWHMVDLIWLPLFSLLYIT